ncbi:MAG: phosphotransferase, partial [Solirubrobacterales bacterium]
MSETPEGIDREGVEAWFGANVRGAKPPLEFERIAGGRSNLTYRVTDSEGRRWALRRPPLGKTLGSAHDMGREHTVIGALQPTAVPVPPLAGFCENDEVNGAPFFVM